MEGKIIFLVQHFWEFDIHKKKISMRRRESHSYLFFIFGVNTNKTILLKL